MYPMSIRRTATIPVIYKQENILAVVELGGKVMNKNWIYEQFFIEGLNGTKEKILNMIIERGGTEKDFKDMLNKAKERINAELNLATTKGKNENY